jgi:hypothetical protein
MDIEKISVEDVRPGRSGRSGKGKKYCKYADAIEKHIPWIKEQIINNDVVRIRTADLAKEMGFEFEKRHPTSIYWALKFVLFQDGIVVDTGTHKSGDKLLIMRMANDKDCLPPSLAKFVDSE